MRPAAAVPLMGFFDLVAERGRWVTQGSSRGTYSGCFWQPRKARSCLTNRSGVSALVPRPTTTRSPEEVASEKAHLLTHREGEPQWTVDSGQWAGQIKTCM